MPFRPIQIHVCSMGVHCKTSRGEIFHAKTADDVDGWSLCRVLDP